MMSRILILLTSLALFSCSGHVLVSTKYCKALMGNWEYETPQRYDFLIEEKVWQVSTWENAPEEKMVKDFLQKKGIECFSVESLAVEITQSFGDVLVSALPFVDRTTIRLRGRLGSIEKKKNQVMDDDDDPTDGANL